MNVMVSLKNVFETYSLISCPMHKMFELESLIKLVLFNTLRLLQFDSGNKTIFEQRKALFYCFIQFSWINTNMESVTEYYRMYKSFRQNKKLFQSLITIKTIDYNIDELDKFEFKSVCVRDILVCIYFLFHLKNGSDIFLCLHQALQELYNTVKIFGSETFSLHESIIWHFGLIFDFMYGKNLQQLDKDIIQQFISSPMLESNNKIVRGQIISCLSKLANIYQDEEFLSKLLNLIDQNLHQKDEILITASLCALIEIPSICLKEHFLIETVLTTQKIIKIESELVDLTVDVVSRYLPLHLNDLFNILCLYIESLVTFNNRHRFYQRFTKFIGSILIYVKDVQFFEKILKILELNYLKIPYNEKHSKSLICVFDIVEKLLFANLIGLDLIIEMLPYIDKFVNCQDFELYIKMANCLTLIIWFYSEPLMVKTEGKFSSMVKLSYNVLFYLTTHQIKHINSEEQHRKLDKIYQLFYCLFKAVVVKMPLSIESGEMIDLIILLFQTVMEHKYPWTEEKWILQCYLLLFHIDINYIYKFLSKLPNMKFQPLLKNVLKFISINVNNVENKEDQIFNAVVLAKIVDFMEHSSNKILEKIIKYPLKDHEDSYIEISIMDSLTLSLYILSQTILYRPEKMKHIDNFKINKIFSKWMFEMNKIKENNIVNLLKVDLLAYDGIKWLKDYYARKQSSKSISKIQKIHKDFF